MTFMLAFKFDYARPHVTALLMFLQCLANTYKNLTSIKNYLSGAKHFVISIAGDPTAFQSQELSNMLRALLRLSSHIPRQAPELSLQCLKDVSDILAVLSPDGQTARAVILVGYASFLRESNLLPCPGASPHHLRRRTSGLLKQSRIREGRSAFRFRPCRRATARSGPGAPTSHASLSTQMLPPSCWTSRLRPSGSWHSFGRHYKGLAIRPPTLSPSTPYVDPALATQQGWAPQRLTYVTWDMVIGGCPMTILPSTNYLTLQRALTISPPATPYFYIFYIT